MASKRDYDVVTAALDKLLRDDIDKYVPRMFRGKIPAEMVPHLAAQCAREAVAALDADRALQEKERDH